MNDNKKNLTENELKLYCLNIVADSKLSKLAKLQMLNFIKEASEVQLKALVLDGKIVTIDEQSEKIINDRFNNLLEVQAGAIARSFLTLWGFRISPLLFAAYRKIRSNFDVCTKKCGTYELNTKRRQYCMAKCKLEKAMKTIPIITKSIPNCASAKNPEMCKQKASEKLVKTKKRIITLQNLIKRYEKEAKEKNISA